MEGASGWGIGLGEHRHGIDGGDLDRWGGGGEGGVEVLHRREKLGSERGIAGAEDLVADGDDGDGGGWEVGEDVGGGPLGGRRGVAGERRDVAVGDADDDGDAGAGEGLDDGWVGAVEPDFGDRR